jgi:uncharacterized membrane protein
MRRTGSFLSILVVAVAALLIGAADASAQTFRFRVCNNSDYVASVAISAHVSPTDERFKVQGWWTVGARNCEWIGYFPKGWFYYYAEERARQRVIWEGKEIKLCVRHPGPWERINTTSYTCRSDETLRGFDAEFIKGDTGSFTVTLNAN